MIWFNRKEEDFIPKKEEMDNALYRIIPFDSLLRILAEQQNTLVKTSKWEDVYENFLLKEDLKPAKVKKILEPLVDSLYGQCWTTKQSSDALWRIYSPDKKSVRIKTTIGRLWNSLNTLKQSGDVYVGSVNYFSQNSIRNELLKRSPVKVELFIQMLIASFFVKRKSFSHESEYRVIYVKSESEEDNSAVSYSIDPMDFIMNVYFDPRADEQYFKSCKNILTTAFKYPVNRIYKSTLYDFKPLEISLKR